MTTKIKILRSKANNERKRPKIRKNSQKFEVKIVFVENIMKFRGNRRPKFVEKS